MSLDTLERTRALLLNEHVPYRLAVASAAVCNLTATLYEDRYGLKIPEWRLIMVLQEDGPSTQQALVKRAGMDKVTVSRAAQSLAKRRLITRAPHEHDGRSHHLILTDEGERLFDAVAPTAIACESHILDGFSPNEIDTLMRLLRRIEDAACNRQG
ncbi:MAG: MarR family winged helix-turn-helix transcriptional regulator [Asticcacaulis sp.]